MATDPDDNIIVGRDCGQSMWTVMKLTSNGESLWSTELVPVAYLSDIATNSNGYIVITGFREGTYQSMWFTFQITPDGQTDWMRTFTSNWGPDETRGVCVDHSDNVIVGGNRGIYGWNRQWYPYFIKYSKKGEVLAEAIDTSYWGNFWGTKPATDRWGNILLPGGGLSAKHGEGYNWYGGFLLKYDPDGNPLWQWFSDTAYDGWLQFYKCVTDSSGNIYTAGNPWGWGVSPLAIEFRRLPPAGDTVLRFPYVFRENGSGCRIEKVSLAIDSKGDVIAAAKVGTGVSANDTGYVLKFTNWPVGIKEEKERREVPCYYLATVINVGTPIRLDFPQGTRMEVYDRTGRLINREREGDRLSLSTGVYFLRILSGNQKERRKLVVIK